MAEKLTTKEKEELNIWDHINSFIEVYNKMIKKEWTW